MQNRPITVFGLSVLLFAMFAPHARKAGAQTGDPVERSELALERGDLFFTEGRVLPACQMYEVAYAVAPEYWKPASRHARCLAMLGKPASAVKIAQRHGATFTTGFPLLLSLARWERAAGQSQQAMVHYQACIDVAEWAEEPSIEIADILLEAGRYGEARDILMRVSRHAPNNLAVYHRLADACRHLEDLEWEEYSLRELAVRGVNPRRNLVLLARFYNENGQLAAALQVLQLLRFPNRSGRNHLPPEKFAPLGTK